MGTPASGAETRRNKEVAMRELRARGYPLGVCAVALHHAGDDIERANQIGQDVTGIGAAAHDSSLLIGW